MHRIDGAGHINNTFVNEDLTLLRAPTEVTPEWLNAVQGEIANVVLDTGVTLNKANNTQLLVAIKKIIADGMLALAAAAGFSANFLDSGYIKFPNWFFGFTIQWVKGVSDASGIMAVSWPIAFPNGLIGGIANEANPQGWSGTNVLTVWGFSADSSLTQARAHSRSISGASGAVVSSGIAGRIIGWGH